MKQYSKPLMRRRQVGASLIEFGIVLIISGAVLLVAFKLSQPLSGDTTAEEADRVLETAEAALIEVAIATARLPPSEFGRIQQGVLSDQDQQKLRYRVAPELTILPAVQFKPLGINVDRAANELDFCSSLYEYSGQRLPISSGSFTGGAAFILEYRPFQATPWDPSEAVPLPGSAEANDAIREGRYFRVMTPEELFARLSCANKLSAASNLARAWQVAKATAALAKLDVNRLQADREQAEQDKALAQFMIFRNSFATVVNQVEAAEALFDLMGSMPTPDFLAFSLATFGLLQANIANGIYHAVAARRLEGQEELITRTKSAMGASEAASKRAANSEDVALRAAGDALRKKADL
ncbi:type II secretion system protein [Piscinibacter aquaticus]|uniref:Type II secretion system protein n=1 Tax=Piscinibacter aquaticus TaxID=392597 RepID=A0A5C6TN54_9BURK|nr:type II secretion system protein [Piscinibacter aquaticus]